MQLTVGSEARGEMQGDKARSGFWPTRQRGDMLSICAQVPQDLALSNAIRTTV